MISVSDYSSWKQDKITIAFYEACRARVEDAKEQLAASAGLDSVQDNFLRGFIHAYNEITDFRVEDVQ
jgi:hypothetical protein